jgi:hypothetical protein
MVDPLLVDLRAQAIPAFVDAVSAILAGDALDAEASEALLGPWRRVTDNSI